MISTSPEWMAEAITVTPDSFFQDGFQLTAEKACMQALILALVRILHHTINTDTALAFLPGSG